MNPHLKQVLYFLLGEEDTELPRDILRDSIWLLLVAFALSLFRSTIEHLLGRLRGSSFLSTVDESLFYTAIIAIVCCSLKRIYNWLRWGGGENDTCRTFYSQYNMGICRCRADAWECLLGNTPNALPALNRGRFRDANSSSPHLHLERNGAIRVKRTLKWRERLKTAVSARWREYARRACLCIRCRL